MKSYKVLETIGNTPLVELSRYSPSKRVQIFAKLEGGNPGGSIKDRVAKHLIDTAIRERFLTKEKIIIEATSGNTGIGLAMVSAVYGYKFTAVMSESASIERQKMIRQYGADLILTNGNGGTNYALEVAKGIVKENPDKYVMLDQFSNIANVEAHYLSTGLEIIRDIPEITHFVAGMGTGGTLMGIGKRLKEFNGNIKIIGLEPKVGSKIQGLRNMTAYTPPIFDKSKLDSVISIADDEGAFELARDLFINEGISVGMSSGANLWGAIEVAKSVGDGNIVTVFPDRGDRYVSTC